MNIDQEGKQRAILRRYLQDGEAVVPSTRKRILQALSEEEQPSSDSTLTPAQKRLKYMLPELFETPPAGTQDSNFAKDMRYTRTTDPLMLALSPARRRLRNGVALATVVALILATVSVFDHYIFRSAGTLSGLQTQVAKDHPGGLPEPLATNQTREAPASPGITLSPIQTTDTSQGWNGLVLLTGTGATYNIIGTYNYLNGDYRKLAESSATMQFDGIGSYGQNMLYHVEQNGRILYYTLNQLPLTGFFYGLDEENALNAIWMPDNLHVLIATLYSGVIMVDTRTGQSQTFLPDLKTTGLKFYHDGYLYFLGGSDRETDTLFRINVVSGVVQQVAGHAEGDDFWLSPDGMTIYYKSAGPIGRDDVYAASSDGSSSEVIRPDGQPIGYGLDDSLVIMRQVDHTFDAVQLGATPAQDRVLFSDVAPGAASLCNPSFSLRTICDTTNIALAPYGHALVVIASYPDGSRKVWSDDLTTGKHVVMMEPPEDTAMMVPGWDRIAA